jgi:heat shock protein beta-11
MPDLALEVNGASIHCATCFDPRYPPSAMIDGDDRTYWTSTGGFPNEIVLSLGDTSKVQSIRIQSTGVRKLVIESSDGPSANMWETQVESDVDEEIGGAQQITSFQTPKLVAAYLKFRVEKGFGDFFTVNRISIDGRTFGSSGSSSKKSRNIDLPGKRDRPRSH